MSIAESLHIADGQFLDIVANTQAEYELVTIWDDRKYKSKPKEKDMTEKDLKTKIIEKSDDISKILSKGKDCEIRKSANGVTVAEVSKKVVSR
jgi:ribosomal protein L15